jgi:outer membrane protein OmpA-like peptidoglycan-associated protein
MKLRPLTAIAPLIVACGPNRYPEQRSMADAPARTSSNPPARIASAADDRDESDVAISPDVRRACGIADADAVFVYNWAKVRDRDCVILKQLADCLTTGPLKGRRIDLVGRGTHGKLEYDTLVGQWRADNVKVALINAGANSGQIATTSRAEDEVRSVDEADLPAERRVDVLLGN